MLASLHRWADTWLPDDPAMVQRDPDVVLGWLARTVRAGALPAEPVVLELSPYEHSRRYWLVLQDGAAPYGCLNDPLLDNSRYVYVLCAPTTLLALARGRQDWPHALRDGSLTITGSPDLCRRVPDWFAPLAAPATSASY